MQINLSELLTQEGKAKTYELPIDMETFRFTGGEYPVLSETGIRMTIVHEKDRHLKISGEGGVTLGIPCDRCLEQTAVPVEFTFEKEISLNTTDRDGEDAFDEEPFVDGYELDANRMIRGDLFMALPMKVLCRPDCKGICKTCGANLNLTTCNCEEETGDPRMSVIRDIFKNFKEV